VTIARELDARIDRYNEALHEQAQTSSKVYLIAALHILKATFLCLLLPSAAGATRSPRRAG